MPPRMERIHVFLNAARGLGVLEALVADGHGVDAVHVPQAVAPKPEIAGAAARLGIRLSAVADANAPEFVAALRAARPRLAVVAGFSTILGRAVHATPELGTINCHAGKLPQYRGGSPLNWQIMNGETEAGISVLRVDDGIDSGDLLAEASLPIGPEDDIATLHDKANAAFPGLVVATVRRFAAGNFSGRRQDQAAAVYWHQRNDADGRIDWRASAKRVHDTVRALTTPYPGAFTHLDGRRLRILRTSLDVPPVRGVPGRIVHVSGIGPLAVCADRALRVVEWRFEDLGSARLATGARFE
jgi:methionyl-tRNA formyltransferase